MVVSGRAHIKIMMLAVVVIALQHTARAQSDTTKYSIFTTLKGKITPKEKNIYWAEFLVEAGPIFNHAGGDAQRLVDESHYQAVSAKFAWQMPPNHIYSQIYRLPKLGVGFFSGNFKNKDIGYPQALFGWFEIPFTYPRPNQHFSFGFSGGFGWAWDFDTYNEYNQSNLFISTTRNCYVDLSLYASYHVNEYFQLSLSAGLKHFSNGARQKPNMGINILPIGLSAKFVAANHDQVGTWRRPTIPEYEKHWRLNTMYAMGQKQNSIGAPVYWKHTVGVSVLYQPSYKYRVGGGLDLFISTGEMDSTLVNRSKASDIFSPAVAFRWEWVLLPRLVVPFDFGVYLTRRHPQNDERRQFYERVGVRGYVTKNLWIGITIKAHAATADFFEWGVGYTFHHDKNVTRTLPVN